MLTMYQMHHPKTDTDRLYVKWKEGGRGLVQIEAAVVPVGGVFYFISFFLALFFLVILFYTHTYIYSCILLVLADGTVHLAVEQRKSRSPIIRMAKASS